MDRKDYVNTEYDLVMHLVLICHMGAPETQRILCLCILHIEISLKTVCKLTLIIPTKSLIYQVPFTYLMQPFVNPGFIRNIFGLIA